MSTKSFGGPWTLEKLNILELYLKAYTTALKKQPSEDNPFRLTYIDAFAGDGSYQTEEYEEFHQLTDGSAKIALAVTDKPFDRLVFIDKNKDRCQTLAKMKAERPNRNIDVLNKDANDALPRICQNLEPKDRAVVFLDPFATEVDWATVETIALTKKIDCWILFPQMAITRMMPKNNKPPESLHPKLDRIFGGREHWQAIYQPSQQQRLAIFSEEPAEERTSRQIADCYRDRLKSTFPAVAPTRRTLKNSKHTPIFELFFAASNPRSGPALPIADHILKNW